LQHDALSIAREASAAPAVTLKRGKPEVNLRKQPISQPIHRGAAVPAGITGSKSAEGCSASCRIVLVAEMNSRLAA